MYLFFAYFNSFMVFLHFLMFLIIHFFILMVRASLQAEISSNNSYFGKVELKPDGKICCATNNFAPVCFTELEEACVNVTEIVCDVSMSTTPHTWPCDVNLTKMLHYTMSFNK